MDSYNQLINRLTKSSENAGAQFIEIAKWDDYPIYGIKAGNEQAESSLLIAAGLHGDEPGGVYGLSAWMENSLPTYIEDMFICILPCLNPFGFEKNQRESKEGLDLNRQFYNLDSVLVQGINDFLGSQRFKIAVDCHEDIEFETFYLWELAKTHKIWSEQVINSAMAKVEISNNELPDGLYTRNGVITVDYDIVKERAKNKLKGRPFAHYISESHTDFAMTTELPGLLQLQQRIELQEIILNTIAKICID